MDIDEREDDGFDEGDGTSSRGDHSEGEDSMADSGTDGEGMRNVQYTRSDTCSYEVGLKEKNMMLMSPSIAFGSNDWDDFELERAENGSASQLFDESWQRAESSGVEFGNAGLTSLTLHSPGSIDVKDEGVGSKGVPLASEEVHGAANFPNSHFGGSANAILKPTEKEVVETNKDTYVFERKVNSDDESIEYLEGCHVYNIFEKPNSSSHMGSMNGIKDKDDYSDITEQTSGYEEAHVAITKEQQFHQEQLKPTEKKVVETNKGAPVFEKKVNSDDESIEYLEGCHVYNIFEKPNSLSPMGSMNGIKDEDDHIDITEQASGYEETHVAKVKDQQFRQELLGSPSEMVPGQGSGSIDNIFEDISTKKTIEDDPVETPVDYKSYSVSSRPEGNMTSIINELDQSDAKLPPRKGTNAELNAFYDEVVHDMEEILMDSNDSPITRLRPSNVTLHTTQPSPSRDAGSTASTSDAFDSFPLTSHHDRIDGIEVVGAKQKKGNISLSERLVGVKEHTVYVIRVWSGEDKWEVERRYRDFYTLYSRLKSLFADHGWTLPSSWSAVELESRKFYGVSSPDVVAERSALIQECLRSIIQFNYPSCLPNALTWFLSPPNALHNSPESDSLYYESATGSNTENIPTLGNTVSLIVDIRQHKSVKQMLEEQQCICPGCHQHLEGGKTRFQELVQTFGLGKPRFCEYTGQLFCSSCHTNDTAVLPARVLHHWDFTQYPVSQLAKCYLDSITDQPMLCVTAVNPFLLSKVKVLFHVASTRRKIRALLDYVHCPFRGSVYRGLGSRIYLIESTDFFSLRNLIDLSRGAFAALPTNLETILKKIHDHITEQCLVCCDAGIPCEARQSCNDISSLIFPFQDEDEIRRCHTCNSPFHKLCFTKVNECSCGAPLKPNVATQSMSDLNLVPSGGDDRSEGALSLFRMKSDLGLRSSTEFLSKLLSTERRENSATDHQESSNVILMGSLPGNSL